MSKIGQTHPNVTGDIDAMEQMEIEELHRQMDEDPGYQAWADAYDADIVIPEEPF